MTKKIFMIRNNGYYKIFALMLIVFVAGSSCKKFLDRKPLGATLEDIHQGGVEGQIFGLYGAIRNPDVAGQAFNGIPWLCMNAMRSDDAEEIAESNNVHGMIDMFGYLKDDWEDGLYWDQHYALIGLANTALQTIDSLKLSDPSSLTNEAEAKWFRALAYFDMVRVYGEVPKIDFRIYSASQANIPKSSISDIYALIDGDLTFAEQHLPLNWRNATGSDPYPGRLTSGAAKTLHAKTLLYRNQYSQVLNLCKSVIASNEYSLHANYWSLWKTSAENSEESVFEIQNYVSPGQANANGGYGDYGSFWGTCQGIRGPSNTQWDLGWGWNTPTQNLVDAYEAGDLRKNATILFSGQSDDPANGGYGKTLPTAAALNANNVQYWNKKLYTDPNEQLQAGSVHLNGYTNMRLLRYADVLLMAAEASNELNGASDSTQIKTWVNAIRQRAGLGNIAYTDKATMRANIKHERRVEFGAEGERFFDLQRWGDAVSVLGPLGYTEPKHKYFPLPQSTVDKSNGVLKQNQYW
jgi:starch-binding outer membrane protein, SusD/RagB family